MILLFKKIRWKNFLSAGNQWIEINLDACQTTLIVGENGSGKSTFLDALSFALYGRSFRRVLKNQLLNTINNRECVVELEFQLGVKTYLVRRGIKPSIFEVHQDGVLLNQDADSKEYQEFFEKQIFKLNYSSFRQVVVLGSAAFVPFMQLEKKDRGKMIEGLLGTEIFSVMATLLKDKVSSNKDAVVQVDAFIAAVERTIEIEKRRNQERKQNAVEMIAEKQQKIIELDYQILEADLQRSAAESTVNDLQGELKEEPVVQKRFRELVTLIASLKAKRTSLHNHLSFFEKNETCPTCTQKISDEVKQKAQDRSGEVNELTTAISDAEAFEKKTSDKVLDLARTKEWLQKFQSSVREHDSKIALWTSLKYDIDADIDKIRDQTEKFEGETGDLANAERELKEYVEQREQLINQRNLNEMAGLLLKDTGIKTKIVKQYIPIINKLVNKYLASMDFFVNFELDENFQEKVKSRFRDEFSYDSFSEGEKARLDLALLFTWRALAKMRNSASANLLILDEVFDGSLDAQGNEELLKIIDGLTTGNNVFVITHKTDAYVDKFQRVIRFEKTKNFSRIVDSN